LTLAAFAANGSANGCRNRYYFLTSIVSRLWRSFACCATVDNDSSFFRAQFKHPKSDECHCGRLHSLHQHHHVPLIVPPIIWFVVYFAQRLLYGRPFARTATNTTYFGKWSILNRGNPASVTSRAKVCL